MEFKFRHGENRSASTLLPQQRTLALFTVPLVSGHPLRGGFPGIIPTTRMYPTSVPINPEEVIRREMEREQIRINPEEVIRREIEREHIRINPEEVIRREMEREQIRREMEKDEIRREILAGEMARRMELEEEVRRELMSERALKMPIHRMEGITYGERVSLSMIPGRRLHNSVHNSNVFGGPQPQLAHKVDITQFYKQTPNETLTNKPNIVLSGVKSKEVLGNVLSGVKYKEVLDVNDVKRKLEASFQVDDKRSGSSLEKKPKKDWGCALCHIVTTSEKGLNDHLQGKKHKIKEASRTPKIGLVARRQDGEKFQPGMKLAYKGKLEPVKMDLVVQETQDLGGTDNENESTTEEKVQKTKTLTARKKFNFYCAFCQVRTHSEIIMQNHKNGKKHLANVKKHSPNNSVGAVCAAENSE